MEQQDDRETDQMRLERQKEGQTELQNEGMADRMMLTRDRSLGGLVE